MRINRCNEHYRFPVLGVVLLLFVVVAFFCEYVKAAVSDGQPVSAAVTNAAFMDKNTTTTFTTALIDAQGGLELSGVVDSTSSGSNQNVTLTKTLTTFTNGSLTSIENLTIANRVDGTLITITNQTGGSVTLKHLSGGTSSQQINTGFGADLSLPNGSGTNLYYDTTNSKWQVITLGATNLASTTYVTGVLPVGNGGTGRSTLTNHGVLVGATTSAITQLAAAATGTVLAGQGRAERQGRWVFLGHLLAW